MINSVLGMSKTVNPHEPVFKALADPTRRGLFERLCREGDATVVDLHAGTSVSQPVVSKHLKILRNAGLVRHHKRGRYTVYTPQPEALGPLVDWARQMKGFWEARFDDLEDLLKRMDQ